MGKGRFQQYIKVMQVIIVKRISDNKEYALKKVQINSLKQKDKENALNEVRILASL